MSTSIIRAQMNADLRAAMKARATVAVLRSLIAALDNAEAVAVDASTLPVVPTTERHEVPRKVLTPEAIRQLLQTELADRQQAHANYMALGLEHAAARLQLEIALIGTYL